MMTATLTIDPSRLLHLDVTSAAITRPDGDTSNEFTWWNGNVLSETDSLIEKINDAASGTTILAWSGNLSPHFFESLPMTWLRPGREAFNGVLEKVTPLLKEKGVTLCFRPCARHVLSDPQSCMQFLLAHEDAPLAIALDPAAMFETSMLNTPEDHLVRMFETLGDRCAAAVLSDVPDPGAEDEPTHFERPLQLGVGRLPVETIQALLDRTVPASIPVMMPSKTGS